MYSYVSFVHLSVPICLETGYRDLLELTLTQSIADRKRKGGLICSDLYTQFCAYNDQSIDPGPKLQYK